MKEIENFIRRNEINPYLSGYFGSRKMGYPELEALFKNTSIQNYIEYLSGEFMNYVLAGRTNISYYHTLDEISEKDDNFDNLIASFTRKIITDNNL